MLARVKTFVRSETCAKIRADKRRIIIWASVGFGIVFLLWLWFYLRPDTWRYYTDEISFAQLAKNVEPRPVVWGEPEAAKGVCNGPDDMAEASMSSDGRMMVFTRGLSKGNADLFVSKWDGREWGVAEPLRALNSQFNETGPSFSGDGRQLFFSTDRPGGRGGYDIWVARWDGAEFAWPLPLTLMVNTEFDEISPSPAPDDDTLYFSSNRPQKPLTEEEEGLSSLELRRKYNEEDYDIFEANRIPAGVTNREVERAMSMLYSLRESALTDKKVMEKLGGTSKSEKAVERAMAWLATNQEADGRWDIGRHGGEQGHDVAATAFALLTFFGRSELPDRDCRYRKEVEKGLKWLLSQQDKITGDMRGERPKQNAMYDHGVAALALAEGYGLTKSEDLYGPAQAAIDFIVDGQNAKDGGWRYQPKEPGDMSVSGWMILALKSAELSGLHVPAHTFEGVRKWLQRVSGGKQGGVYGYQNSGGNQPAMIATGYFCSQLMGLSPNTLKAFETADKLTDRGVADNDVYYAYYGTLCAYQNQGPFWRKWHKELEDKFINAQNNDGTWTAHGNHADKMGRSIVTSLVALSLQAHYRYTPFYGLGYEPSKESRNCSRFGLDDLSEVPLYRRARRLTEVSSAGHDLHPAITAHGDFMYFASDRAGGSGGLDIYRSRISGKERAEPENIGRIINSDADEASPSLRMAGFNLLFSSNREKAGGKKHRVYSSVSCFVDKEDVGKKDDVRLTLWDDPLPLPGQFNISTNKISAAFMPDDAVIGFVRDVEDKNDLGLLSVEWDGRIWGDLEQKGKAGSLYEEKGAVFSSDGKKVYFASARKGGFGGYDIWSAVRDGDNWVKISNLGPGVNSENNETAPALMPDGQKLFFAADISSDSTGVDIYEADLSVEAASIKSVRLDAVSSMANDMCPSVSPMGDLFYFASDRGSRNGTKDIFVSRIVDGAVLAPVSMGVELNARKTDDDMPALRMQGFDMVFSSNRGQEDIGRYQLFAATVREVVGRVDYSRWYAFKDLVSKIKWWVLLLIAMIVAMIYLLRHIEDLTSLFHKCLAISILLHVIALLIMSFWFITQELMDSTEALTMEVTVDVNSLAKEKLALDMQAKVAELAPTEVSVVIERDVEPVPMPEFKPAELEQVQPLVTKTTDKSFVADVTPSKESEEKASKMEAIEDLEKLPEFEMMELDVVMEEAEAKPAAVETAEFKPEVVQEALAPEKSTEADVKNVPAEKDQMSSEVVKAVENKTKELKEVIDVSAAQEAKVSPDKIQTVTVEVAAFDVPEIQMDVVMEEAEVKQAEAKTEEFKPETVQENVLAAKTDMGLKAAKPLDMPREEADVEGRGASVTNMLTEAEMRADDGLIAVSAGVEVVADLSMMNSAAAESAVFEVPDIAADTVMDVAEVSSEAGKQAVEEFVPTVVQEDVVIERSGRVVAEVGPVKAIAKGSDVASDVAAGKRVDDVTAEQAAIIAVSISSEMSAAGAEVKILKPAAADFAVPEMEFDTIMEEMSAMAAAKSEGVGTSEFSPAVDFKQAVSERGRYGAVKTAAAFAGIPGVSSDLTGKVSETPDVKGSGLVGATASAEIRRDRFAPGAAVAKVSDFAVPDAVVDVVMDTVAVFTGGKSDSKKAETFSPAMIQEFAPVRRGEKRGSEGRLAVGPARYETVSKEAVASEKMSGIKVSSSGGELIVASAGVEARGSLPEMRGSGRVVGLLVKSTEMGSEMQLDAPGELDVPRGAGESISPVIFKNPGKLSDEVVEGLGGSSLTQGTILKALDWFTANQEPDGHWDVEKHGGSAGHDIGGTSLILLCYYGWGATHNDEGQYKETVKKAVDWLVSQMRLGGDLHHGESQAMYDQGIATIALCEAYGVTKDKALYEPARQAVTFIINAQNLNSGGWRYKPGDLSSDTSVLGWQYMALKSAELAGISVPRDVFARAERWLDRVSAGKHGGLYGYQAPAKDQPAMIATGMFCRQLSLVSPLDPRMREGALYMKGRPLTIQDMDYYYLYYGTLALYQHQGVIWEQWNERMKEILPELQQNTGPHAGTWNPRGPNSQVMGRAVVTAFGTLSLEVYYRILPIYGFAANRDDESVDSSDESVPAL